MKQTLNTQSRVRSCCSKWSGVAWLISITATIALLSASCSSSDSNQGASTAGAAGTGGSAGSGGTGGEDLVVYCTKACEAPATCFTQAGDGYAITCVAQCQKELSDKGFLNDEAAPKLFQALHDHGPDPNCELDANAGYGFGWIDAQEPTLLAGGKLDVKHPEIIEELVNMQTECDPVSNGTPPTPEFIAGAWEGFYERVYKFHPTYRDKLVACKDLWQGGTSDGCLAWGDCLYANDPLAAAPNTNWLGTFAGQ